MLRIAEIGPVTYELYVMKANTLPTESCRSNTKFAPNIYNSVERNCTIRLSVIVFHCPSIFICFCFSIISFWFWSNSSCFLSKILNSLTSRTPPTVSPNHFAYFGFLYELVHNLLLFLAKYFITTHLIGMNRRTSIVILKSMINNPIMPPVMLNACVITKKTLLSATDVIWLISMLILFNVSA